MTHCRCQLIHLCHTTLLFLAVVQKHPLFSPLRGTILTAALANQTKRGTKIQKSQFYIALPLALLLHAVFPGFCCNSAPRRHPLAIRPYLQRLFSKFGRSECWEQALDRHRNPCSVTMAALGDSLCQRPAPNLAGGIFFPSVTSFAGVSLQSCITQLSLVFLWFCLGDKPGTLPCSTWSFPGRSPVEVIPQAGNEGSAELIHGFVVIQRKKPEQKVTRARILMDLIPSLLEHRVPTNP